MTQLRHRVARYARRGNASPVSRSRRSCPAPAIFSRSPVCLAAPEPFHAVGIYYEDFAQTSDAEVIALLRDLDRRSAAAERVIWPSSRSKVHGMSPPARAS